MLIEKLIEAKQKKIHQAPCHTNRASSLGDPCERYLVFERTRWHEKALHDVNLQFIFDEGNLQEHAVLRDLEDAGFQVIEQQRDYEYTVKGGKITGHLDGKVVLDGEPIPIEVKSCSPYVFNALTTIEDLKGSKYRHLQRYPAQLTLYLLLANAGRGLLLFKNKVNGQIKELEVTLDLAYAEELLQKAERINAHVAAGTLPAPIPYTEAICGQCAYAHLPCPPEVTRTAMEFVDFPELEAKLNRRAELEAAKKEYEILDKDVKAQLKGKDKLVIGDFLVQGAEKTRKGYAVKETTYWQTSIERLSPQKPEDV
jgi:hypothetical protein